MSFLKLTLDVPPPVNAYYRNVRGRMVLSARGREYKKHVAEYLAEHQYRKFYESRLSVFIVFHAARRGKTDLDGRLKAVLDAMQDAGLYNDDEQVDRLTIVRGEVLRGGKLTVYIEEIKASNDDKKTVGDFRSAWDQGKYDSSRSSRCAGGKQSNDSGSGDSGNREIASRTQETQDI